MPVESYLSDICKCLSNGLINTVEKHVAKRFARLVTSRGYVEERHVPFVFLIHVCFTLFFRHTRRSGWGGSPIGVFVTPRPDFYGGPMRCTCSSWSLCYRWSSWRSAIRASAGRSGVLWNAGIIWRRDMRKSDSFFFIFSFHKFFRSMN